MDLFNFATIVPVLIGVLATALVSYIVYYVKTRKGNRVRFILTESKQLLKLIDLEASEIKIQYKDDPLSNLFLTEYEIENEGDKDLKDFEAIFKIGPKENISYIGVTCIDPLERTKIDMTTGYENKESIYLEFILKRPYLNSTKRDKREVIKVSFLSDIEIEIYPVAGGEGWYSGDFRYANEEEHKKRDTIFYTIVLLVFFLLGMWVTVNSAMLYFDPRISDLERYLYILVFGIILTGTIFALVQTILTDRKK